MFQFQFKLGWESSFFLSFFFAENPCLDSIAWRMKESGKEVADV
jgi:hypothetical protein